MGDSQVKEVPCQEAAWAGQGTERVSPLPIDSQETAGKSRSRKNLQILKFLLDYFQVPIDTEVVASLISSWRDDHDHNRTKHHSQHVRH